MLVFGRNVAIDLLKKNKNIRKIYFQEGFSDKTIISLSEKAKIPVKVCSKKEMDHLCSGVHQGIILDIPDYEYTDLKELLQSDESFVVMLDHLEDPHNLGAIIRTCEAAGVKSVIIPKDRQVPINSTVMKTSVGTLDSVKVVQVSNLVNAIGQLKEHGFWVVGTSLENSQDYRSVDYNGKIVLIIGNENNGISKLVSDNCDYLVKIPMYGTTNSLNASVAAGIMIYVVIRNRK